MAAIRYGGRAPQKKRIFLSADDGQEPTTGSPRFFHCLPVGREDTSQPCAARDSASSGGEAAVFLSLSNALRQRDIPHRKRSRRVYTFAPLRWRFRSCRPIVRLRRRSRQREGGNHPQCTPAKPSLSRSRWTGPVARPGRRCREWVAPMYSPPSLGGIRPAPFRSQVPGGRRILPLVMISLADLRPRKIARSIGHAQRRIVLRLLPVRCGKPHSAPPVMPWTPGRTTTGTGSPARMPIKTIYRHNQEFYKKLLVAGALQLRRRAGALCRRQLGPDPLSTACTTISRLSGTTSSRWRGKLGPRVESRFSTTSPIRQCRSLESRGSAGTEIRSHGESFEFHVTAAVSEFGNPRGGEPVAVVFAPRALLSASSAQAENIRHYYVMATDALRHRASMMGTGAMVTRKTASCDRTATSPLGAAESGNRRRPRSPPR